MGAILKIRNKRATLQISVLMSGGSSVASILSSDSIALYQSLSSSTIITTKVVSVNTLVVHTLSWNVRPTKEVYVPLHCAIGTSIQSNGPPQVSGSFYIAHQCIYNPSIRSGIENNY